MPAITRMVMFFLLFCALPASAAENTPPRTVHVLVALCDNISQGIVPVPPALGNGQDTLKNLYWGAGYGVKTFLRKQTDWKESESVKNPAPGILERIVFRHTATNTILIADAYDGAYIKETIVDFFDYSAGRKKLALSVKGSPVPAGGAASFIIYIGHNGLMDFSLDQTPVNADGRTRDAAVFACISDRDFAAALHRAGARPLILTTNLMCPEAYTLHALVNAWIQGETPQRMHEAVAQAYNTYQKCGLTGARRLFTTMSR